MVDLSITLNLYNDSEIEELEVIEQLQQGNQPLNLDQHLLLHLIEKILNCDAVFQPISVTLIEACVPHIQQTEAFANILIPALYEVAYSSNEIPMAASYTDIGLSVQPDNRELLRAAAGIYTDLTKYSEAIECAQKCFSLSEKLHEKVFDNHLVIKTMMSAGGYSKELPAVFQRHEQLIQDLVNQKLSKIDGMGSIVRLYNTSFFFPYVRDSLAQNIRLRRQVAGVCQEQLENKFEEKVQKYRQRNLPIKDDNHLKTPLKIGYLSHCLRRHSVGWISRWLFQYHDRENFQVYAYLLAAENRTDPMVQWYYNKSTKAYKYGLGGPEVADQIYDDEIDILVDLDSLTLSNTCGIVALKSAPIQATWLGWDSSEIPTVDYFIADPYVVPENAGEHYGESIWRLPQTYVAVDGFDVGVPTLRRDQLDLPNDAVIYFSTQRGPKYNPHTLRLQMRIIKEVPNSYFLIKGFGDAESLNSFLIEIAEQEGVGSDRLRFLPRVAFEELHRANMGIADVVLDTYPYNGATTTLETLWMCLPMVTRVGEQFSARNSYTMMINAGIEEGIAWTDEEYVDWGIRLGEDEALRQQISWKLRKARQTAPLWNTQQFTRDMENAYREMWRRYLETGR